LDNASQQGIQRKLCINGTAQTPTDTSIRKLVVKILKQPVYG